MDKILFKSGVYNRDETFQFDRVYRRSQRVALWDA